MMGKNLVLGFTARGEPVVYFFPTRNTKQMEVKRTMHAVGPRAIPHSRR